MAIEHRSLQLRIVETVFRVLAKTYIAVHRPKVVVVAGSVGKTSTKLMLAKFLETEKKVSYMDDSYNNGLGLYLSVFELKVPRGGLGGWMKQLARACGHFFKHSSILLLEYGIDKPGDMDQMVAFARPHAAILTAVTPEHMEFLNTIEIVAEEETKSIRASKEFGVVNAVDVNKKYLSKVDTPMFFYGDDHTDANFRVTNSTASSTTVDIILEDTEMKNQTTHLISEALIRQMTGALLMARKLGVSDASLKKVLPEIRPTPGRMNPIPGCKGSLLIDDSANFSPVAGVLALQTLGRVPAKHRIAILGNMHELGDYIDEGYEQVAVEFRHADILVLVGELSGEHFGRLAREAGFIEEKNVFYFDSSIEAGQFVRDNLVEEGDVVLIKGPFGGYYLEEATKVLLREKADVRLLTRQSPFWDRKKRAHFGPTYDEV